MSYISNALFLILTFLSVYVQVFFLVTFFENKKKIIHRKGPTTLNNYPGVTVIVPCWNEAETIAKTANSLLNLHYPKDKLNIFLIDDGSKDDTWQIMQTFEQYPNVKIFHKKNGGKHTALNLGLDHIQTDFVACLDADSEAHPEALARLMSYFENDPALMAVAPSIIVNDPKNIIQKAQKAEYDMAVYVKKMLGFLGAIHVTPGPLTVFRKKVFDDLGVYHHAHNTEDMEIAFRMQTNHYKIEQCNDAYVYTNTPRTIGKLYRQRLRWIYGFINNTLDYRKAIFKKKYGNFSLFTVPSGIISIFAATYLFGRMIYSFGHLMYTKILQFQAIGIHTISPALHFDPFFFNVNSFLVVSILLYSSVILAMVLGRKMAGEKFGLSINMFYFMFIYSIIAPFWLMKAVYATIFDRKPAWR